MKRLSYDDYLKIRPLLKLQKLLSGEHDEMQFIVVHQVFELWFKLILFELDAIRENMYRHRIEPCLRSFKRIHLIERLFIKHLEIIETMRRQDFFRFRQILEPASGFQSVQFREIEFLSGLKDERYLQLYSGKNKKRLKKRMKESSLWDSFLYVINLHSSQNRSMEISKAIRKPLHRKLALAMLEYDKLFSTWRARHIKMTRKVIGTRPGTGHETVDKLIALGYKKMGSGGIGYLKTTLKKRFYPLLWKIF